MKKWLAVLMSFMMITAFSACQSREELPTAQPEKEEEIEEVKADEEIAEAEQPNEGQSKQPEEKEDSQTKPEEQPAVPEKTENKPAEESKREEQPTAPQKTESKPAEQPKPEEQPTAPQKTESKPAEQPKPETKPTAAEIKDCFSEIEVYVAGGEDGGLNYNLDAKASQELLERLPFDQMILSEKKEDLSDFDMSSGNFVRLTSSDMNTLAFYQSKEQVLCIVDDQNSYYDPPQGIYDTALALAKEFSAKALPDGTWS